jgi:hypothetical protein
MFSKATIYWRGWIAIIALYWLLLSLGLLPGCLSPAASQDDRRERPRECSAQPCSVPVRGTSTLRARTTYDDYQGATLSIEQGVVLDDGRVRNDWDLLFGNDRDQARDYFSVNMVTDDRSFIVDLGDVPLEQLPETVDPADYATGLYGEHDELPVRRGHVYVIRTVDSDTTQYAAVKVLAHELNHSVTVRWYRSREPGRLVLPLADVEL